MRQLVFRHGPIQSIFRTASCLWSGVVGLGMKMATLVVVGSLSLLGLFAYLGRAALNDDIQPTMQERVVLAQTTARHDENLANAFQ